MWGWQPGRVARWLVASRVPFVTIGGTAVACYVKDRRPADLDIVIVPSAEAAQRTIRALRVAIERYGLVADGRGVALDEGLIRQGQELIVPLNCGKLHVVGDHLPKQIDVARVVARRRWWLVDRVLLPICARDDLIAIKVANGSPKDLSDVVALRRVDAKRTQGAGCS